jgi:hypothetical protein
MEVSFEMKKEVENKISTLSKESHIEIFFLLEKTGLKYTTNHNGIFFNIGTISNEDFNKLKKMVDFYYENEKKLAESNYKRFNIFNTNPESKTDSSDSSDSSDNEEESKVKLDLNKMDKKMDKDVKKLVMMKSKKSTKFKGTQARVLQQIKNMSGKKKVNEITQS